MASSGLDAGVRLMNFKGPYLQAMRQQAPQMFNELARSGQLDDHVQKKSEEAHALLEQSLEPEPKGVDGLPRDPQALRLAEERVLGEMLDFPVADDLAVPRSRAEIINLAPKRRE
jgi:hypothetical protein